MRRVFDFRTIESASQYTEFGEVVEASKMVEHNIAKDAEFKVSRFATSIVSNEIEMQTV